MDVFSKAKRSWNMSRIKSGGNLSTELMLIQIFKKEKIRGWRRNQKIYGKPDFVFLKHKIAVFVDGTFWHGHPTKAKIPQSNKKFWLKKINNNKKRDRQTNVYLRKKGWNVIRIWEHELNLTSVGQKINKIKRLLLSII